MSHINENLSQLQ